MALDDSIRAPYRITQLGAILCVFEGVLGIIFLDYLVKMMPFNINPTQLLVQEILGVIIASAILGYLIYRERKESLVKDVFLYVIVAALSVLIIGALMSSLLILIGAIVCYRRL